MKQSILETEIEKWASANDYPMTPRKFYEEIQGENEISREIGLDESLMAVMRLYRKAKGLAPLTPEQEEKEKREMAHEESSDLMRHVLTPTGFLKYTAFFKNSINGMPNEMTYEEHLKRVGGLPEESIDFVHAKKRFKNWRSDRTSLRERFDEGEFYGLNLSEGSSAFRIDPYSRGRERDVLYLGDEVELSSHNLFVLARLKTFYSRMKKLEAIPRNQRGYQDILAAFTKLIELANQ